MHCATDKTTIQHHSRKKVLRMFNKVYVPPPPSRKQSSEGVLRNFEKVM